MSQLKKRWESAVLTAIISMMAGGFMWTMIAVFRAPDVEDPIADTLPPEQRRTVRENPRIYHDPMNIHDFRAAAGMSVEDAALEAGADELMPEIPVIRDISSPMVDPIMDAQLNYSYLSRQNRENDPRLQEEEEDQDRSGWGWLADDIARKRDDRSASKTEEDAKAAEEEEDAAAARGDEDGRTEQATAGLFFTDDLYRGDTGREDSFSRPVIRDDAFGTERNGRNGLDEPGENDEEDPRPAWDRASGFSDRDAVAVRDPFSTSEERDTIRGELSDWRMSDNRDAFSGMSYAQEGDGSGLFGYGGEDRFGDAANSRIVEAAGSGGRSDYFTSDAMFNSGGGYQPMGVSAFRSDTMLSGSGVFGSPSVSVVTPSVSPSSGFGSSGSSYEPSISTFRSFEEESGLSTPKALPW